MPLPGRKWGAARSGGQRLLSQASDDLDEVVGRVSATHGRSAYIRCCSAGWYVAYKLEKTGFGSIHCVAEQAEDHMRPTIRSNILVIVLSVISWLFFYYLQPITDPLDAKGTFVVVVFFWAAIHGLRVLISRRR